MRHTTRRASLMTPALCAPGLGTATAQAQTAWPIQPVRIVVPFAPDLSRALGQQFAAENKAAAGGKVN